MNRYQDIVGKISYGLFLTIVVLLPFPQICLRYACVLWFIAWLLEGRWLRRFQWSVFSFQIPFILFGLWYVWKTISGFWAADHAAWSWQMERYLTFLLMVPVGIWGVNRYYNWKTAGRVLVISCIAAVPLYLMWMTALFYHPEWTANMSFQEPWIQHENWFTFVSENISHFKHRLFLCCVELFGCIIACQLYRRRWAILIPSLIVMLSMIPLTASRQSILSAIVLGVGIAIYALPQAKRLKYSVGIIAVGLIAVWGFIHFHPRIQQVDIHDFTEMRTLSYDHDIRFNIWGAALQHPQDYLAYGIGAGQSKNYLGEKYQEAGFDYYALEKFHAHNQYLEELMEIGLPGLLLFLLAWLSIPICAKKEGRQTAVLFTILFMLSMCTDCMFGKFDGIALWAIGLVFILLQTNAECEEQSARDTETH